jgi:hypothetical protein
VATVPSRDGGRTNCFVMFMQVTDCTFLSLHLFKCDAGCLRTLRLLLIEPHPFGSVAGRGSLGYAKSGSAAGRWSLDFTVVGLLALCKQRV